MKKLIYLSCFVLFFASCKKAEQPVSLPVAVPVVATLTTDPITGITASTANAGGNVISDGGSVVSVKGICFATSGSPTISNNKIVAGTGTGTFTAALTGLTPNTTYYVRSFATNQEGTGYGPEQSFTTTIPAFVTDVDGNIYHTIKIGTQVWMVENLKTAKYRDGTPVTYRSDKNDWAGNREAMCNYQHDPNTGDIYGKLYNWYAAASTHKLAPAGWHIPTNDEFNTLINFLGGASIAGGSLKEVGVTHWQSPNFGANNSSGFKGLAAGLRNTGTSFFSISFEQLKNSGMWWSSTESGTGNAWALWLAFNDAIAGKANQSKGYGLSVRCIMD